MPEGGSDVVSKSYALPAGAWDSHVHVVDEDVYPLHPSHPYRPKKATLEDLLAFEKTVAAEHVCLVAFSVYHDDNRCLLDSLSRLQGTGRAVACIDPKTILDADLKEMHRLGVRGIRLNLATSGKAVDLESIMEAADRVRWLGWCIQIYCTLEQIAEIAPIVPDLRIRVVIDHIGAPNGKLCPQDQVGYREFMSLLDAGLVWTKLSGTYRFHNMPGLDEYVEEILQRAPDQVVWASDWPHSGGTSANPGGDRNKVQEYRRIDDQAFVAQCREWCHQDPELIQKIWVDNPRRLWQYDA